MLEVSVVVRLRYIQSEVFELVRRLSGRHVRNSDHG